MFTSKSQHMIAHSSFLICQNVIEHHYLKCFHLYVYLKPEEEIRCIYNLDPEV